MSNECDGLYSEEALSSVYDMLLFQTVATSFVTKTLFRLRRELYSIERDVVASRLALSQDASSTIGQSIDTYTSFGMKSLFGLKSPDMMTLSPLTSLQGK